jgi:DNA modification methylase
MKYKIVQKSCEDMSYIGDECISSIFTSPPYALAKDYKSKGIGETDNVDAYQEYLNRMSTVFKECYRVLQPGRMIGVNIADVIQTDKGGSHKKPIRFHFYVLLKKAGFEYCEVIIWKKPDGMSTQKRFGVFIQNPYPMYYKPNNIYEPILVFKKPGKFEFRKQDKLDYRKFKEYQTDVWSLTPETGVNHPAPYPYKLPYIFFRLHAFKNETVLDCFMGSGSSMLAARKLRMNCIGYEINNDYIELIKKRVGFAVSGQGRIEDFKPEWKNQDEFDVIK